ncbi:MAG TPA: branched-chain amino acid ABC transporter permease [Thermodesulfobacteriota bacterium]|nr:branched-chain amino acid ABC transporter permease [Thermodesulfobacteriota bacterium]
MKLFARFGFSGIVTLVLGIALVLLPLLPGEYVVVVGAEILILGLFAMSFNLLYGYMGEISFGHAAFYGLGAYTTALLMRYFQSGGGQVGYFQFIFSVLMSVPVTALGSLIVGYFCVRLTGIYFAMLSLAFGELLFYIVFSWYSFTKGDDGIQGLMPPPLFQDITWYYYFSLVVVALAMAVLWRITNSPFGYTLRMLRENKNRAAFLGINVRTCMLVNFILAGAFAGLAGALWGPFQRSVSPALLGSMHSGTAVFMTLIGGAKYFSGPILGSMIYTALNGYITLYTVYWPLTIGLIILFVVLFLPGGVLSVVDKQLRLLRTRRVSGQASPKSERGN